MFTLNGKYADATIFTDNIDNETVGQIMYMINHLDFLENSKIAIMPDCHAGKGCVVGTTMTIKDKIVPRFVGSDLGCGVLAVKLIDVRRHPAPGEKPCHTHYSVL